MKFVDIDKMKVTPKYVISDVQHHDHIKYSLKNVPGRIQQGPDRQKQRLALVGYGPSLLNEWEKIKDFDFVMTCSGAHKFLVDRGITPTWHVEVDPRPHKIELIGNPHSQVEYLIASSAHPDVIDYLKNYNIKLWHASINGGVENLPLVFPRGEWVFSGGSNVGLRALILARFLGFNNIDLFGMDCSFPTPKSTQHAEDHPNLVKEVICVPYPKENGKDYYTTPALAHAAKEFFIQMAMLGDFKLTMHGVGLLQAMAEDNYSGFEQRGAIDGVGVAIQAPEIISNDYLALNKQLHQTNQYYGTSGIKYKDDVINIARQHNTTNILDYGCGKGTLSSSLPFSIYEYDPAIPGKDDTPTPVDIVVCTDVLEHIEPEMLDNVLGDLRRCMKVAGYFVINSGPAKKILSDGRNAHLIQENKQWWWKRLDMFFVIDEMIQQGNEIKVWVKPKTHQQQNNAVVFNYVVFDSIKFVEVNDLIRWRVLSIDKKEPVTFNWLNTFTEKDVFVDVGANIGCYSLYAAVKKGASVYAFEPESLNYTTLNQNILINATQDKVRAFCLSLSDKIGLGYLNLQDFRAGSSCHQYNSESDFKGEEMNPVFKQGSFSVSLDYLVENQMIPQPTKIKIDVDGLEHIIVRGAIATISKAQSVLIEVNTNLDYHMEMVSEMEKLGFTYDKSQVEDSIRKEGLFKGVSEFLFYRQ